MSKDAFKIENELLSISESYNYDNLVQIENITRTWFQLMVNLNESPKLRSFFASESYQGEKVGSTLQIKVEEEQLVNRWEIKATKYTRHFLTSGLAIYEITRLTNEATDLDSQLEKIGLSKDEYLQTLVITAESKEEEIQTLRDLSVNNQFSVVTLYRWVGCGMKIPSTASLHLDPNIVWPILEFKAKVGDHEYAYRIENSSNIIRWNVSGEQNDPISSSFGNRGAVVVQDKIVQGQAKGEFNIKGDVIPGSVNLTLPFTCASFDILTKINLGQDDDDQLVIFTS